MPARAEVLIEDPAWAAADLQGLADRATAATFAGLGLEADGFEISILGCDDTRIAALNAAFRGKPSPTNVLAWPAEERAPASPGAAPAAPTPPRELGDIAITAGVCADEARALGLPIAHHATRLLVHGLLHLLGYDHATPQDAARMEGLETEILASMGLPDPYSPEGSASTGARWTENTP